MSGWLTSVEICAGGGGQALGLQQAGFGHQAVVENDPDACNTLRHNRPEWKVVEGDVREFDGRPYEGASLLAGGVPCPPFSIGGRQLGEDDERNLVPELLRLAGEIMPGAVLMENVKGLAQGKFRDYRAWLQGSLRDLGYESEWRVLNACDYGVTQLRPRFVLVAMCGDAWERFEWPEPQPLLQPQATVGRVLYALMKERGWPGVDRWSWNADKIAPTIVGGSKKHGGPDLGPTRAREAWRKLGVNGGSVALEAPGPGDPEDMLPRLTVEMVARLQGFPGTWEFTGSKTARYRMVANAFPPPVARALGIAIARALDG